MRRSVLASLFVAGLAGTAWSNGRPAATSTINFEQGNPQHIAAGMTFGFLRSDDGGTTWKWMCEKAIGYGGTFDPDYAYTPTGALFATTFDGLKVMRDGCTFAAAPPGTTFVSSVELGSNGDVYYAAADQSDGKIYRSTDDGQSFPTSGNPGQNNDWWDSILVSPADPTRVYVTGYHYIKKCNAASSNQGVTCTQDTDCLGTGAACESIKVFLLFRTDDSVAYTAMTTTGITTSNNSTIDVVGADHADKNIVYAHVNLENGTVGDGIYKSVNGGQTWAKILTTTDPFGLVFLAKSDGTLIASTQTSGSQSSAGGASCTSEATCNWQVMANAPHINCLVEHPTTHEVWACTHNFDSPGIPMDGYGIMKTADLQTWTGVLRYQDINGVVSCDPGTVQHDQCVASYQSKPSVWCCLETQLGITDTSVDCTGAASCDLQPDGSSDAGNTMVNPPKKGCCEAGGSGSGALVLALGTTALLWRRRKR